MWYIGADGTPVELIWYEDIDPLERFREGKVGRGICSACYCEERAVFLTIRSGRNWALCESHAQILTTGYWRPGLEPGSVMSTRPRKHQAKRRMRGEIPGETIGHEDRP